MRVLIDATPLLVKSAGGKNYLYHWIGHLRRVAGADIIGTFPAMEECVLRHDVSVAGKWRTVRGLAMLGLGNHTPFPVIDVAARGADLFHASVLVHRPPRRMLLTSTIHDLTAFLMPELHPPSNRRAEK